MRKRSSYRPKSVLINPVAYVLESITPVAQHHGHLIGLKIKNHDAMAALTRGRATRNDIDLIIIMANTCEALHRAGFGAEYKGVLREGLDAIHAVAQRGITTGRFLLRASEMNAINYLMELHDAQMDVVTVRDVEHATRCVANEHRNKKMRTIVGTTGETI
jgi:hypothetical protein